jgi:serine protease Do
MKKTILTALILGSFVAFAQQADVQIQKEKSLAPIQKEQQEIIIRRNGDKDVSLKVDINGDNITINGKPLVEFKDDNVTINKRKMIIHDGGDMMTFNFDGPHGMDEWMGLDELKGMKGRGMSSRAFLGVTTEKSTGGAKIVEIAKGSAAEKAGLKIDDVITKVDTETVTDGESLADIISSKKPKAAIKIAYLRDNKKKEVSAVLGERTENRSMTYSFKKPNVMVRPFVNPRTQITPMPDGNMMYDNFNSDNFNFGPMESFGGDFPRQKRLGLKIQDTEEGGNVKVIEVADSSAAQKAGLKKDDIITEINGQKINNTDEAREELQEAASKSSYTIKAKRNGVDMSFDIKIPKKLKTANL